MAFILLNFQTIIGFVCVIVLLVCFIIACTSVERTKNESIRSRELLENINKIVITYYKRDFKIKNVTDANSESDSVQRIKNELG